MKNHACLNLLFLIASLISSATVPAFAKEFTVVNREARIQETVVPQSAPLVLTFLKEVSLDAGQKQEYPTTLILGHPLKDSNGNVIAPKNSPVSVKLKTTGKEVQIIPESIVTENQVIPIKASSLVLSGSKITVTSGAEKAKQITPICTRIGAGLSGSISGGDIEASQLGALLGNGACSLIAVTSPEKTYVVKIPQGSIYVFSLEAPVTLPSVLKDTQLTKPTESQKKPKLST